ncbi:hypothetical protein MKJ04_03255 [Pontibacter sp. E15-1]|uniref:hypothetical protein n=1 Tax=Pontibacter sp. E15-1 TaxID=2919918 RepID=UPI001F4F1631|nr:hypothetical protein [Pontibacter sp. E15-1]MCJ8163844.1 hypothetical protein [Pontibacter sp. E15-1]
MAKRVSSFFLVLLLAIVACERPAPPASADAEQAAYNLSAYLEQQQQRLTAEKPMVLKSVSAEGKPTETIETSAVDWEDELAVFKETDLNRPALQEYYTRQEQVLADGNILVEYTRLKDTEPLVHHLRLELGPDRKLRKLNALIQDQNVLFYSRRNIQLSTDTATGNIASYRVEGVQKLILSDSLHYRVDANL